MHWLCGLFQRALGLSNNACTQSPLEMSMLPLWAAGLPYLLLKSLNRQSILFLKPLIIYFYYVYIVSMNRALEYFIDNKASIVYCIFILLIPLTMPLFAPFECPHMYCIINYNCVCKLFLSTYLPLYYIK